MNSKIDRDDFGQQISLQRGYKLAEILEGFDAMQARIAEQETELATLRAENAHLKRALELVDALRNKERNLPL